MLVLQTPSNIQQQRTKTLHAEQLVS